MSKNKIRVIIALAAAVAIVAAMAACGKIEDDSAKSTDGSDLSSSESVTQDTTLSQETTDPSETEEVTEPQVTTSEPQETEPEVTTDPAVTTEPEVTQTVPDETQPVTEPQTPQTSESLYEKIVDVATQQIGIPFTMGGSSPEEGFDTSGLTYYCVNAAGGDFPRSLKNQLESGDKIPYNELSAGDIVYFAAEPGGEASFCGVYVGGGLIIYSPVPDEFVKTANITTNYWTSRFVTGIRPYAAQ